MLPGFENLQPVTAGQILARDRKVDVVAAEAALLFMPLYQEQGYDGFFLTRPIKPLWMKISTLLRRLHLGAIPRWLPGVRPHPTRAHTIMVSRWVARWQVVNIFHLLGYRHRRSENGHLVFTRRQHDIWQRDVSTADGRVPG
jgi:succinylglutamate desuccinylase